MATLDDAALTGEVERAIINAAAPAFDIRVEVIGGVARLQGVVSTLAEKTAAAEAAASVAGIRRVDNMLTVEDPRGLSDPQIERKAEEALEQAPDVDVHEVGVSVQDSTAHLVGYANSEAQRDAAVRAVSGAEGVKTVVDDVDVSPGRDVDWVDIRNGVIDALDASPDLNPFSIDVDVETDGRVVLTGSVNSETVRRRAEEITRGVAGVKNVVDRLDVRPRM